MSELLTRLNPKTARFDIGTGGIHEITDQDIAAALGMVRNKLGAGMLEYMHWPKERQQYQFEIECFNLLRRAYDESINAEIAFHLAAVRGRRLDRSGIPSLTWPPFEARRLSLYVRLVVAVLAEIVAGAECKVCNGRGSASTPAGHVECGECRGSGVLHNPQRSRAARMGVAVSHFQAKWEAPYRWLLTELVNAMIEANDEFRSALGRKSA